MNTKKVILFIIILVFIAGYTLLKKNNDNNIINISKIHTEVLSLNPEYLEIIEKYISKNQDFVINFVIREQGNKNVFGDVVFTNIIKNTNTIIATFNTSLDNFGSTIYVEDSQLFFIETIHLGGNDAVSKEKVVDFSEYI